MIADYETSESCLHFRRYSGHRIQLRGSRCSARNHSGNRYHCLHRYYILYIMCICRPYVFLYGNTKIITASLLHINIDRRTGNIRTSIRASCGNTSYRGWTIDRLHELEYNTSFSGITFIYFGFLSLAARCTLQRDANCRKNYYTSISCELYFKYENIC